MTASRSSESLTCKIWSHTASWTRAGCSSPRWKNSAAIVELKSSICSRVGNSAAEKPVAEDPNRDTMSLLHSSSDIMDSVTTAEASNGRPKIVSAKESIALGSSLDPSVADVATGTTRPSEYPDSDSVNGNELCDFRNSPNLRSSNATSVPCAPSYVWNSSSTIYRSVLADFAIISCSAGRSSSSSSIL